MASIDVITAVSSCEKNCEYFEVEKVIFYMDGTPYNIEYRCINLSKCLSLLNALMKASK